IRVDQASRAVLVVIGLVGREGVPVRIRHGIEVIQVSEELVEAVYRWQELVQIAEMIFAELSGAVSLRFKRRGQRAGLRRKADIGPRLTDGRHASAERNFAG